MVIARAVAQGAAPRSFAPGGANAPLARLRAKLGPEAIEQAVVVAVLRDAGVLFCAAPNGAKLRKAVAAEAQAVGLEAGVPDLLVFEGSVALEFKSPKYRPAPPDADPLDYSHVRAEQVAWIRALRDLGWRAEVVYSADDALGVLRAEGVLPELGGGA